MARLSGSELFVCLQHVHIMKVETADEAVCYVTPLNRSHATSPHVYAARNTDVRPRLYGQAFTPPHFCGLASP